MKELLGEEGNEYGTRCPREQKRGGRRRGTEEGIGIRKGRDEGRELARGHILLLVSTTTTNIRVSTTIYLQVRGGFGG